MSRGWSIRPIFIAVAGVTVAGMLVVYLLGLRVTWTNAELSRSKEAVAAVREVLSTLKDAETGERGFLVTGDEAYLDPYASALARLPGRLAMLDAAVADGKLNKQHAQRIREKANEKLEFLANAIRLRREGGLDAALSVVRNGQSKRLMDEVRAEVAAAEQEMMANQRLLEQRVAGADVVRTSVSLLVAIVTLLFTIWAFREIQRVLKEQLEAQRNDRETQSRIDGIVSSAMDAIISVDEQQNIILFNVAAEQMFRCPAATALGSPLDRFIPPRFRPSHRDHVREFGATGQSSRTMGTPYLTISGLRGDGEEFPIDASISQITVEGKRIYSVIVRDVTDRKRAEAELREKHEEVQRLNATLEQRVEQRTEALAEANRELEAFGYSVSHDLRAPLRHVTGFIELLSRHLDDRLDEKGRRYIKTISDAGVRMGHLIDDLLTLSRIGRVAMENSEVDLRRLVDEARAQLAGEIAGRRVDWAIGDLPHVRGDAELLRNAMVNLLANALKYTRTREQSRIEVGCERKDGELICFIRDNGVGFDMKFVDKLFGVFQRLHRAEEFEGTGVGLASVRRIINKHGGRTWAHGEVDKGAAFFFSLPEAGASHE